jgi:protein RecA
MKLGSPSASSIPFPPDPSRSTSPRGRRDPAWPDHRDLRPGVVGQDDRLPARDRRGAEARRIAAFIDVEHALDPGYARACGVNVDELLVSQPDTGEQALEITETLIRSGGIDCVVVDSVAALVPRAEIEGEMGDSFVGIQARLMSQALRKLTGAVSRSNTALVFTNQLREKIGVMFGNPETTPAAAR